MPDASESPVQIRVYATGDGRAVIERSRGAAVSLSADEIQAVIEGLRACYDYCAAWKQPALEREGADVAEIGR